MARISTYQPDINVTGSDRWIGSDWQSPTKITKNFTADAVADYYNKTAKISTGQFAWAFLPYADPQPQMVFEKVNYYNDTININDLSGNLRVAILSLGNTEPFPFIQDQWLGKVILAYKASDPGVYSTYAVQSIVDDGDYFLMDLAFVEGSSGMIDKGESVVFGLFAAPNGVTAVTAEFPLLSSGGTTPDISIDPSYEIPTAVQIQHFQEAYDQKINIVTSNKPSTTSRAIYFQQQDGGELSTSWQESFIFVQDLPNTIWSVAHNLNKFPSVSVVDSSGSIVIGEVTYVDNNNVTITFSASFSGRAYLN
jgi:hypothetical protein